MPIPVITDFFLVQVVLSPPAGFNNKFVNTWFFRNDIAAPSDIDDVADAARTVLDAFYDGNLGATPTRMTPFLSPVIQRSTVQYRVYDLGQAAPRTPVIRTPASTWTAAGGGATAMPNEVAAVLSYRSGPAGQAGGTLDRTRRGRIYIGPLTNTSASGGSSDPDAVMSTVLRQRIVDGAKDVLNTSQDISWHQYSRKENRMSPVSGGFVDSRFDTQRRRGEESAVRTIWP